jgi:hypothetical protein
MNAAVSGGGAPYAPSPPQQIEEGPRVMDRGLICLATFARFRSLVADSEQLLSLVPRTGLGRTTHSVGVDTVDLPERFCAGPRMGRACRGPLHRFHRTRPGTSLCSDRRCVTTVLHADPCVHTAGNKLRRLPNGQRPSCLSHITFFSLRQRSEERATISLFALTLHETKNNRRPKAVNKP